MTDTILPKRYRYPFISRVRLRNFKSVAEGDVGLAPFTLVVGENSSGKSTVLQSLRLLQQGMEDHSSNGIFRLNGERIALDTIDDLRTDIWTMDMSVLVGISLVVPDYKTAPYFDEDDKEILTVYYTDNRVPVPDAFCLVWDIVLQDIVAGEIGATYIKRLHFEVVNIEDLEGSFSLRLRSSVQELDGSTLLNVDSLTNASIYTSDERALFEAKLDAANIGSAFPIVVALKGPLPADLFVERDIPEVRAYIQERAEEAFAKLSTDEKLQFLKETMSAELIEQLKTKGKDKQLSTIRSELGPSSWEHDRWGNICSDVEFYSNYLRYWFLDNKFQYLGPLRKTPKHTGEDPGAVARGTIGQQGELTGRVLRNSGDSWVQVPMPDEGHMSKVKLVEAVDSWAKHLGLVEGVLIEDRAAEGIRIKVKPHGMDSSVPLTSVGVGVSQLLPVLVLCLLAEPGSVILLEQPELHLHPALQQRLADFFIAMVRSGRQLIVETHSEYMVSRLRRRIVEDPDDELLGMSKVIFAERDRETGLSSYREVELSPLGAIEEWPAGFFDQAAEEERAIIMGGVRRLKKLAAERQ